MASTSCWSPHKGAVSFTFDDGRPSQLNRAIPAMDKAGIRGSFYLNPKGDHWRERLKPWVEVCARGHEVGNHSLSHLCSNNLLNASGGLDDVTVEEIETDILSAQGRLSEAFPDRAQWTFAYPCYQTFVGRGRHQASYVPVVGRHFLCGRAGGEYGIANAPEHVDLACAHGLATDRMSGFEMIGLVESLAMKGQWVILVFHDIDGSRLTVGGYDFGLLLEYLARRREELFVAPVVEVAEKIQTYQRGLGDD